jgi:hypothetical protein
MKVILVASINGKKEQKFFYLSIIGTIKELGHDIFYEHIIKENPETVTKTHKRNIKFHKNIIKNIREADLIISEITHESVSVGYLIHEALLHNKPVIAMSRLDSTPNMSVFLENFKNFTFIPYEKAFEIKDILPKAIKEINFEKHKRFNFLLTEKLDEKLKNIAAKNNTSKSEFLRSLIRSL